jgi:regulatory protein
MAPATDFSFCLLSGPDSYTYGTHKETPGVTKEIKISKMRPAGIGYRLRITGLDEPLWVPSELVHQYRLKEGIVLTAPQLEQLQAEAQLAACDQSAARYLAMREHTIGELKLKLARKGFDIETIRPIVKKLKSAGLLDDERLAHALARRTFERKPSGRSYLVALLRRKMIEPTLAERAVNQLLESVDETESAVQALERKWPAPAQIQVESVRTKAYSYLSRRGFGYGSAKEAVAQYFESEEKADED